VRATCAALAAMVAMAGCSSAAALSGPAVFGRVVEPDGTPVGAAQVVVLWQGTLRTAFHGSGAMCLLALATVTDDAGRFSVPGWQRAFDNAALYDYDIRVYKRGYRRAEGETSGADTGRGLAAVPPDGVTVRLRRFSGSVTERLDALARPAARAGCAEGGASRANALPYYRAMNEELKALLATPEGQALQRAEQQDRDDREKRNLAPPDKTIAQDLDRVIRALEQARDGELYRPAR
jgi:hypothetical protein